MPSSSAHPPRPLVVVANRLPVDVQIDADGEVTLATSPGGLVTALRPVLAANHGQWVGWCGMVDAPELLQQPTTTDDGMTLIPVSLDEDDFADFYEGMSNATLWPLYHDRIVAPTYRADWWQRYAAVNRRFAEHTAATAPANADVWVQDYQLQLVPGILRQLRDDVRIGFFCHIPFPGPDIFRQLPWRDEILRGLLSADVLGFQLVSCAENFVATIARLRPDCVITTSDQATDSGCTVVATITTPDGHQVTVGAFPISIDVAKVTTIAAGTDPQRLREELGNPRTIIGGVDRLDYTKGILARLDAIEQLLEQGRIDPATTCFIQIATPSRERISDYQHTRSQVDEAVGRINGTYGALGQQVVHYIHSTWPAERLYELYRAVDVMVVNAFKDGMNLVAKEYVTCHSPEPGVLVLSEGTGSACELSQAHIINPFDPTGLADAIADAVQLIHTHPEQAAATMQAMASTVSDHDVHDWAHSFLQYLQQA